MGKINKSYIFRMYPTQNQIELLNKSFGISRYIYNYFLEKNYNNKYINKFQCIKELPLLIKEKEWLKGVEKPICEDRQVKIYFCLLFYQN